MDVEEIIKKLAYCNLKQVHRDTKIPYDRMFKWTKGKGKPKQEDYNTLVEYFKNGTNSTVFTTEEVLLQSFSPEKIIEEQKKEITFWRDKFLEVNEKYTTLLEEKASKSDQPETA